MSTNAVPGKDTKAYKQAYINGWNAWQRGSVDALEKADARQVSAGWYDGFFDADAGREKGTLLRYRTVEDWQAAVEAEEEQAEVDRQHVADRHPTAQDFNERPTFTTPDLLPSGQTGWTIDRETRRNLRADYRFRRQVLGQGRYETKGAVTQLLQLLQDAEDAAQSWVDAGLPEALAETGSWTEDVNDTKVPATWPVQPIAAGTKAAQDATQCGVCLRYWDDTISTSLTPTPSGRCPFEPFHDEEDEAVERRQPELWTVQAAVSWTDKGGFTHTRQLPTFFLDGRVQGIVSEAHAHQLAAEIVGSFPRPATSQVHISLGRS